MSYDDAEDFAAETLLDPTSAPRMTGLLSGEGGAVQVRGVAGRTIKPVSAAVVIGLGGTGVQTVARIKSAVDAGRIDQEAHNAVTFLAIDAVGTDKMNPPLPDGVGLSGDLMNLTGFNAGAYLDGQLPNDRFLQQWWDNDYRVDRGELIDGLKRERMLGRLCFHQEVPRVRKLIQQKMSEALGIRADVVAAGRGGADGGEIAVYIVCSSVGGTGSSGFLEVLGAVHLAAKDLSVTAKIRPFIVLPGAFSSSLKDQQSVLAIESAQRANAYAFFKELDHFIKNKQEFLESLGHKDSIAPGVDLVHSVYLFDATVGSGKLINSVSDIYEIIAESVYQLMFSTIGRAILGSDGANIERILKEYDDFGKPRKYCSLGLSRVLFPGDTLRFHVVMWWSDWFLRSGFLKQLSATDTETLKDSEEVANLLETLSSLTQQAIEGQFDDVVRDFIDVGRDAPAGLQANPDVTNAQDTLSTIEDLIPSVTMEIRRVLEDLRPRVLTNLNDLIERGVFASSASVPRARQIVSLLLRRLNEQRVNAEQSETAQIAARGIASERVDERLEDLEEAAGRNILQAAVAQVVGLVNDEVFTTGDAAEELGNAIKDWTRAVVDAEFAQARLAYLRRAVRSVQALSDELESAQTQMEQMADRARGLWERDELIGKDAGPKATSVLIPNDTLPEVELSQLSRSVRATVQAEHAKKLSDAELAVFHGALIRSSLTRGFFDVGSRDPLRQKRATDALLARLEWEALRYALERDHEDGERLPRLPRGLPEAADEVGQRELLVTSLQGIRDLSQEVCWAWEPGRFALDSSLDGEDGASASDRPRVTSAVIAHESMTEMLSAEFNLPESRTPAPDPERVLALSVEWAVPIHCLPVVDRWREDYDRLRRKREAQRTNHPEIGVEPPNHIDRRFESFDELVPEYFRPAATAKAFVKGMAIASALTSPKAADVTVALFVRDSTRLPMSPIRQERGKGFVTRRVTVENGQLRPAASGDAVVGSKWFGALRSVGLDIGLQRSIDDCWTVVVESIDSATLTDVIQEKVASKIDRGSKARIVDPSDREALGHLRNAVEDLLDELAQYD